MSIRNSSAIFFILLFVTFLLSACATVPDPVVFSKYPTQPLATSNTPPTKILLIFDISLEEPFFASLPNLRFSKEELIERYYGPVAKGMIRSISEQGIESSYLIHYSQEPVVLPSTGYSHILVERLVKLNETTSTRGYVTGKSHQNRVWSSSLYEKDGSSPLKLINTQTYMSDNAICFGIAIRANKEECKTKYLKLLLSHLSPIGVQDTVVLANEQH